MKKILGILGGLGPLATARFLELTAQMTQAKTEQEHLDMIVYNFPSIPDRTGYILGSNLRSPLPGLCSVVHALENQGVSAIAIPCVTAHYFYDELASRCHTPILNCVELTAKNLARRGIRRAGILATRGTVVSGIFERGLEAQGIQPVLPDEEAQQGLMQLIYEDIKQGRPPRMELYRRAEAQLQSRGAEMMILGCTELSLLPQRENCVDAMAVLAAESIRVCAKPLKPEYACLTAEGESL